MPRYTQEVKDKAVKMAKEGVCLKHIQTEIGPNPKATMRYLMKVGIDYKNLREQLKEKGLLQGLTKKAKTEEKNPKVSPVVVQKQSKNPKVSKK